MAVPKVVLIGGPTSVGKSTVARCIAARYQYNCIPTDDIGKAIRAVTTVQTHPALHAFKDKDYQEYFATISVDLLINHARQSHEIIWPALEMIIRTHATWGDPLVLEGYALWPDWVLAADFTSTGAVWLTFDDDLLEARIRSQASFYEGASDEQALIVNFLRRSSRFNQLMVESALECGAAVIRVKLGHSVEDVADRCVVALMEE